MAICAPHTRLAVAFTVAIALCFAGAAIGTSAELGKVPSVDAFTEINIEESIRKAESAADIGLQSWLVPAYDSKEWSFGRTDGTDKWAILVHASGEGEPLESITRTLHWRLLGF